MTHTEIMLRLKYGIPLHADITKMVAIDIPLELVQCIIEDNSAPEPDNCDCVLECYCDTANEEVNMLFEDVYTLADFYNEHINK